MTTANNMPGYDNTSLLAKDADGKALPWGEQSDLSMGEQGWQNSQTGKGKNQAYNQQQYMNAAHPNVDNGAGNQQWKQDSKTGAWSESQGLNGGLGAAQTSLMNQAQANAAQGVGSGDDARNQAINASYNQAASRLNPQFQQQQEQLQSQLANQGLDPNSQAYQTSMQNFGRQQNDAYSSAMNNAIGQGTAAGTAVFNQNYAANNLPYTQLGALNGLMPGGDTSGLAALNGANQYNASQNAATGQAVGAGIGAFGSIAAAASDENVKDDVERYDTEVAPGVPLASFRYSGDPARRQYVGVIAQDLEKANPGAVSMDANGIRRVSPEYAPVPASHAMAMLPDLSSLSPEDQESIINLSTEDAKRERLIRAKAQADALRNLPLDTNGIKSVGEGIGKGLGSAFDRIGGTIRSGQADDQARALDAAHAQGLGAYMRLGNAQTPDGSTDALAQPMAMPGMSADELQAYPQAVPQGTQTSPTQQQLLAALLRQGLSQDEG